MPIITLTSDFGTKDYRVAAIKGSILGLRNDAVIADISHDIEAYNLLQTAYVLRNAYKYFPKGSIHIISVDSLYRKEVRNLIYKADDHYFITSDNGIMNLIFYDILPESIHEITLAKFEDYIRFVSTDIFVPAAVHLYNGGIADIIGRKIDNPKEASFPRATFNKGLISGEVMYIDNFGNIVSNISKKFFLKNEAGFNRFDIKFRGFVTSTIYNSQTDFIKNWENERDFHGKPIAIFNEEGLLELCIYKGNKNNGAKTLFGVNVGEKIYVEFYK